MKSSTIRIAMALLVVVGLAALAVAFSGPTIPLRTGSAPLRAANSTTGSTTTSRTAADVPATSVRAVGVFNSANQASLAFQSSGRVKDIKVKEGDAVKPGDLLVSLDTTVLDLQVVQAQAALNTAQARLDTLKNPSAADVAAAQAAVASAEATVAQLKTPGENDLIIAKSDLDVAQAALSNAQAAYDRIGGASNPVIGMTPQSLALQQASDVYQKARAVFNSRTSPTDLQFKQAQAGLEQARAALARLTTPNPNDVKSAEAAVMQAQAALDLAKQNIANAQIVAPFGGTVLWVGPHVGESQTPGAPAVVIADLSQMQVQIGADENTLAELKLGQTATIRADALPGVVLTGKVSKIGLLATTTSGIINVPVTVQVDATQSPVAPGLSATLDINVAK